MYCEIVNATFIQTIALMFIVDLQFLLTIVTSLKTALETTYIQMTSLGNRIIFWNFIHIFLTFTLFYTKNTKISYLAEIFSTHKNNKLDTNLLWQFFMKSEQNFNCGKLFSNHVNFT